MTKEKEYEIRNEFDKLDIIYKIDLVFIDNTIKKELLDIQENRKEDYLKFIKEFGMQLKVGIYNDFGINI